MPEAQPTRLQGLSRSLRIAALVLGGILISQCVMVGPRVRGAIEGRVVDPADGRPVTGIEVFVSNDYTPCLATAPRPIGSSWARTDEEGRFRIPGALLLRIPGCGWLSTHPQFMVYHPEFGLQSTWPQPSTPSRPPVLQVSLDPSRHANPHGDLGCRWLTSAGCRHYCELAGRKPCPK